MFELRPRYSREEFARRGKTIYEQNIRPLLGPEDYGKYVLIDIETGEYEIDEDEMSAGDRLTARLPDAQPWLERVGFLSARRFGGFHMERS